MPKIWVSGLYAQDLGIWLLLTAFLSACSATPSSADEATTCGQLVDLAVETFTEARDAAADSTREDFELLTGDAPEILASLHDSQAAISARGTELGCVAAE